MEYQTKQRIQQSLVSKKPLVRALELLAMIHAFLCLTGSHDNQLCLWIIFLHIHNRENR